MIDTLLLLGLPASGKSEIRRFLDHQAPDRLEDLEMRRPIHLDDYPYVAAMRWISGWLRGRNLDPIFFADEDLPFSHSQEWETLIHLLNEDYETVTRSHPPSAGLLDRLDVAREKAGLVPASRSLPTPTRLELERELAATRTAAAALAPLPPRPDGATIVIEFARGGQEGAVPPLPPPLGYRHALTTLSPAISRHASILYVWTTAEESRRRNRNRVAPHGEGSILHHRVPEEVMRADYGIDDLHWLIDQSDRPDTVRVESGREVFHLPTAVFDNRVDLTSFLRDEPARWDAALVATLARRLKELFARL